MALRCGADLSVVPSNDNITPFLWFLRNLPDRLSSTSVQSWASVLSNAGADIESYGQIEHRNFRAQRDRELDGGWTCDLEDVVGFTFSPDPSKWVVYYGKMWQDVHDGINANTRLGK